MMKALVYTGTQQMVFREEPLPVAANNTARESPSIHLSHVVYAAIVAPDYPTCVQNAIYSD